MKVKSVLFSEMRGQLGKQIIGTGWKGRMVFRAYVVPANPNTLKQQCNRDHTKKLLIRYQSFIGNDPTRKGYWNIDALPRSISGYNLMMKLGRASYIFCDAEGVNGVEMGGSYFIKTDVSTAGLFAYEQTSHQFREVVGVGQMIGGQEELFVYTPQAAEMTTFFLIDGRSKPTPPEFADQSPCFNAWKPNIETGVADEAVCDVSPP